MPDGFSMLKHSTNILLYLNPALHAKRFPAFTDFVVEEIEKWIR
jgi:hypothetical protein